MGENKICPVNTVLLDSLVVTNNTGSTLNISMKLLKNLQGHKLNVDQTQFKITRGANCIFQFSLSVPYSSSQRIQNIILLDVEGNSLTYITFSNIIHQKYSLLFKL